MPILPALNCLLPQLGKVRRPKVADRPDGLSLAGVLGRVLLRVLGGVDPPRLPDAAAVAAVALQVLLDVAKLVLGESETFNNANETYSRLYKDALKGGPQVV